MEWNRQRVGAVFGLAAFVAVLVLCCLFSPKEREEIGRESPATDRHRHRLDLAEGISFSRHGCFGMELVRCGKCRLEKRKIGALTLAGFNELVLEDLAVVLPSADIAMEGKPTDGETRVNDLAGFMGLEEDFLRSRGFQMRFSGLRIKKLAVSVLDAATNAVPLFVAARGDAVRNGLRLDGCGVVSGTATNWVGEALLQIKPRPRLVWRGGESSLCLASQ